MNFSITNVGREEGKHVLELEGQPTFIYRYQGVTKTIYGATLVTIPESSTDITINGRPVMLTKHEDRVVLQCGVETLTHMFPASFIGWPSTLAVLDELTKNPALPVIGPRGNGKTTALCLRALEFRSEGHSVNIVTPNTACSDVVRNTLGNAALELYPETHASLLTGVTVSTSRHQGFDRTLVDEIHTIPAHVRPHLTQIHGSVGSLL